MFREEQGVSLARTGVPDRQGRTGTRQLCGWNAAHDEPRILNPEMNFSRENGFDQAGG
jgi:hypothetical protein